MTTFIRQLIIQLHLLAIICLVFGWLLPYRLLIYHLALVPATMIQWWLNDNQCILTQLQRRFEKADSTQNTQEDFTSALLKKLGFNLTSQQVFFVVYGVMVLSFSISLLRFFY